MLGADTYSTHVMQLKRYRRYQLQVRAFTRIGDGALSSPPRIVRTHEDGELSFSCRQVLAMLSVSLQALCNLTPSSEVKLNSGCGVRFQCLVRHRASISRKSRGRPCASCGVHRASRMA